HPLKTMPYVLEGGSIESDGAGSILTNPNKRYRILQKSQIYPNDPQRLEILCLQNASIPPLFA
ncbi:agmatine deiminase, partial [Helicobacter pylori]|nr:agmatine deiminase [Helicobacter pylori]